MPDFLVSQRRPVPDIRGIQGKQHVRASGYWEGACSDFPEAVLCESGLEGGYLVRMIGEDGNSGLRQPQKQNCTKGILGPRPPNLLVGGYSKSQESLP